MSSIDGGWYRFKQVTDHIPSGNKLYRASAPHYGGSGRSQHLTEDSVKFLTDHEIVAIISFNSYPYTDPERSLLEKAQIDYLHLPVEDFHAATEAQLLEANKFYLDHSSTLIHCAYGHGRTGTAVTALQLYYTKGKDPKEAQWAAVNHVEDPSQLEALRAIRDRL